MSGESRPRREVAHRVFAAEFDDATLSYSESDEERAPNYVVTPTGARVNRLFLVGVLTEIEEVGDEMLRGRIVDPTGAFVVYGGQYQPEALSFLERIDPPQFVAVTGKARTFQPEDTDRVYTSVRPESINVVDAATRDRWTVRTAEHTLARASAFDEALRIDADADTDGDDREATLRGRGIDPSIAAGIPRAIDHYGTTREYLAAVRDLAIDAARVVAGEIDADEVGPLSLAPDEGGDVSLEIDRSAAATGVIEAESARSGSGTGLPADRELTTDPPASEPTASPAEPNATGSETDAAPESGTDPEARAAVESTEASTDVETVEDAADAAEVGLDEERGDPTVSADEETVADEAFEPAVGEGSIDDLGAGEAGEELYEMDPEERERIEAEFGTEFETGADIGEPAAAGTQAEPTAATEEPWDVTGDERDTPAEPTQAETGTGAARDHDSEPTEGVPAETPSAEGSTDGDPAVPPAEGEEATTAAEATETAAESEAETETEGEREIDPAEGTTAEPPEDLEDAVMEAMRELDEGNGAEHEAVIEAVTEEYGVGVEAVREAIQNALMSGRCYEPTDSTLKAI